MIFRCIIVTLGFLTALSSFYFLQGSDPLFPHRYVYARIALASALGLGSILMVRTGVENRRASASSMFGAAFLMIGAVCLSAAIDDAINSEASTLSLPDILVVSTLLFGGVGCLYWSRQKPGMSDPDVLHTIPPPESKASAWLKFAPVTTLASGLAVTLILSAFVFFIGGIAEHLLLGALVVGLLFLCLGAALAVGNRLSAKWLVEASASSAILSFTVEQALWTAPYRLLLTFILIKGGMALRASLRSVSPIPRPKAAWAWGWASVIVFGIVGAAGLIRFTAHLLMESRIHHEVAMIRLAGEPSTIEELERTYPEVPSEENAAVGLRPALATLLLPKSDPTRLLPNGGSIVPPIHTWSSEMTHRISNYLSENSTFLVELRHAAAMARCRYEIDLLSGYQMQMRHLAGLKKAALLLALEAMMRAREGHHNASATAISTALKLADTLAAEPTSISQITRLNIQELSCATTEQVLSIHALDDAQLSGLLSLLTAVEDPMALKRALLAERCFGAQLFSGSEERLLSIFPEEDEKKREATVTGLRVMRLIGMMGRDHLNYLRMMSRFIAAAEQPYPARNHAGVELVGEVRKAKSFSSLFHVDVISGMLLPANERMFFRSAHNIATLRCARTAIAVERFRLAHNRLPGSLSDVLSYGLERIPVDPFDGSPLRYKSSETAYCVYSVGPNVRDDGGKPPPLGQLNNVPGTSRYDLTFTVNRTDGPQ